MRGFLQVSLLLPLSLLPLGCGKDYQIASVSGRVLIDNRPLAHAEIRFQPTDGKDFPYSVGFTDDQGNYTLRLENGSDTPGAVVGEHRVLISLNQRTKSPGMAKPPKLGRRPHELVPSQYNRNSTLTCAIPPEGKLDANFDLKSK
jgi:hypothetical protein